MSHGVAHYLLSSTLRASSRRLVQPTRFQSSCFLPRHPTLGGWPTVPRGMHTQASGAAPRGGLLGRRMMLAAGVGGLGVALAVAPGATAIGADPQQMDKALAAFGETPTPTLLHQWLVLKACRIPLLPSLLPPLLRVTHAARLDGPTHWLLRQTAFSHFCGGETAAETEDLMRRLGERSVFTILDLGIETDPADLASAAAGVAFAERIADGVGEAVRVAHMQPGSMVAVKASALTSHPSVLLGWSHGLREMRRQFDEAARGGVSTTREEDVMRMILPEALGVHTPSIKVDAFVQLMGSLAPKDTSEGEMRSLFKKLDRRQAGQLDWPDLLRVWDAERIGSGWGLPGVGEETRVEMLATLGRMRRLGDAARGGERIVPLLIDAEYASVQPAIRHLSQLLGQTHNLPGEAPIVYDTVQMYLRESPGVLSEGLADAERDGRRYAVKMVRGAYLLRERREAQTTGRPDPIWPSKAATDAAYDGGAKWLMTRPEGSVHLVLATHNPESIRLAQSQRGTTATVAYAQLMGMGEMLTAGLASSGARVGKYVVYGGVGDVVPYLVRRVEENADAAGGGGDDLAAIEAVLWTRLRRQRLVQG